MGVELEAGAAAVGRPADVILVDGDPLIDLRRLADPRLVVQGGQVVHVRDRV